MVRVLVTYVTKAKNYKGYYFECMKLRIRGNSIRLRLTKSEVVQFDKTGKVEEIVEFGFEKKYLGYQLHRSTDDERIGAKFEDNLLCISVSKKEADNWLNSDRVGIEAMQRIGGGRSLRILVEKDFACLTPRAHEDESDAFSHPLAADTQ